MLRIPVLRFFSLMVLAAVMLALSPAGGVQAQTSQRCFAETGLCIEGRFEVILASESTVLEVGDSILYDSSIPHRIRNPFDEPARALFVVTPPSF